MRREAPACLSPIPDRQSTYSKVLSQMWYVPRGAVSGFSDTGHRTFLDPRPISYTPKHLAERILAEQAAMEARGTEDGERKTITALFADIKGSMELIEDLDPEEARHIVDPVLQLMMEAVHHYEGYVAQSTGDGIFAFFGAPIAHEDHAQRALYAALRMQEEIKRYANTLRLEGKRPIEIRVGVNTGEVVVRSIRKDDLHADYVPIGHSTSLAARMESLATGGSIVVSEHTHKLTDGYFEFKALGAAKVKGVSEPVNIYEVLGLSPLRTRLQVAARRGLARFVGRQSEIEQIRQALEQAKVGHGQIVGVMGEPGVGKSRLFYEFVGAQHAAPLQTDLHIPPTVQAVLAARIDRLPPEEKALLQILSVIGKEFSLSLLKKVVGRPEDELQGLLAHLQTAEFIYEQPAFPEVEYTFKHALTQEVAYSSLLLERRKVLHEQTAKAIEALFHNRLEDHYSELAQHYSRSGNTQKAIEYLQLAGQQAVQWSANAEAITHLTAALELLKTLPDTPERAHRELALQIALGVPLQSARGWGAPEAERAYSRARRLCERIGEAPQLFLVLWNLWHLYQGQGQWGTAHELAAQLFLLAERAQEPSLLLQACHALWATMSFAGEFVSARNYAEQGIALYDSRQHSSHALLYGAHDPGVCCQAVSSYVLWYLGYPEQALRRSREALNLAQELSHPYNLIMALFSIIQIHQAGREAQVTQEQAEAMIMLSDEQGFPSSLAWGTILRGWGLVEQGQDEKGIAQMSQGFDAYRVTGAGLHRPYLLGLLAEAYGEVGKTKEGLSVIAEALTTVETGERWYEAELYRLKGELSLKSRQVKAGQDKSEVTNPQSPTPYPQSEAEECFQRAIEVARRQSAKSLELRAVMSLARL